MADRILMFIVHLVIVGLTTWLLVALTGARLVWR